MVELGYSVHLCLDHCLPSFISLKRCVFPFHGKQKKMFFFFFLKPKTYKESTESKKMTVIRFLVHHFSGGENVRDDFVYFF